MFRRAAFIWIPSTRWGYRQRSISFGEPTSLQLNTVEGQENFAAHIITQEISVKCKNMFPNLSYPFLLAASDCLAKFTSCRRNIRRFDGARGVGPV